MPSEVTRQEPRKSLPGIEIDNEKFTLNLRPVQSFLKADRLNH
jgi:hypothetical protein